MDIFQNTEPENLSNEPIFHDANRGCSVGEVEKIYLDQLFHKGNVAKNILQTKILYLVFACYKNVKEENV